MKCPENLITHINCYFTSLKISIFIMRPTFFLFNDSKIGNFSHENVRQVLVDIEPVSELNEYLDTSVINLEMASKCNFADLPSASSEKS